MCICEVLGWTSDSPLCSQIRHSPCEDVKTVTVSRQQDVRTPVYYRLERSQIPGEAIGYIRLREFNALAKKDLVIGKVSDI